MAAAQKNRYGAVYGLAKGLGMDRESLHEYIYRETGRASLTELTDPELRRLVVSMGRMKDGGQQAPRRKLPRRACSSQLKGLSAGRQRSPERDGRSPYRCLVSACFSRLCILTG